MRGWGEGWEGNVNSFQHHGHSSEQRLLISASLTEFEVNQCLVMMVGWQLKAKLCLLRCPDKLSGYTHFPSPYLMLQLAVLVAYFAFSVENTKKTLFIIHAPLPFFRTQPILKRAGVFCGGAENSAPISFLLQTLVLPVVVYLYSL